MYYCRKCNKMFSSLHQQYVKSEDKMYQLCPKCGSENIELENNLTEKEKRRILRENKLKRVLGYDLITKFFNSF